MATAKNQPNKEEFPINTLNEYVLIAGQNLDNHSMSLAGLGKFVKAGSQNPAGIIFRTKQQAYRFCAHAIVMAQVLPDEDGEHAFEEVLDAVENL